MTGHIFLISLSMCHQFRLRITHNSERVHFFFVFESKVTLRLPKITTITSNATNRWMFLFFFTIEWENRWKKKMQIILIPIFDFSFEAKRFSLFFVDRNFCKPSYTFQLNNRFHWNILHSNWISFIKIITFLMYHYHRIAARIATVLCSRFACANCALCSEWMY